MRSFIAKLFDRLLCTALALVMVQFPLFFEQYLNTLAGAHSEAAHLYQDIESRAKKLNLSPKVYVDQHIEADNPLFRETGEALRDLMERYESHKSAFKALSQANFWRKPLVFAVHYDPFVGAATRFSPGLPLTLEALAYAVVGVLLGLGFIQLLKLCWRAFVGLVRRLFGIR